MQELQVFVGVDVAKAELVVARHGQTGSRTLPNQAQAISAWLRELPDGACLAMESTGRYHQMLASLAQAALVHGLLRQGGGPVQRQRRIQSRAGRHQSLGRHGGQALGQGLRLFGQRVVFADAAQAAFLSPRASGAAESTQLWS